MELKFPLRKIKAKADLAPKMQRLGIKPYFDRIRATILIPAGDEEIIFNGIIDTGATLTLLPHSVKSFFPDMSTEMHTMWGVVNNEHCRFTVDLGVMPMKLRDALGNTSSVINVPVALAHLQNAPVLIGMKDLLTNYSFSYDSEQKQFSIQI